MAVNIKRRQQKMAKKKAKMKERKKHMRRMNVVGSQESMFTMIGLKNPISSCDVEDSFKTGMVSVLVSRTVNSKVSLLSVFNVDLYCLGIKDCFMKPGSTDMLRGFKNSKPFLSYSPKDAKKLLLEAAAYAAGFGFDPHKEFKYAMKIFGDIDETESEMEFTFGKDGKPFFIAGPYDSPEKCQRIISTLNKNTGEDGSSFITPNPIREFFDEEEGEWEMKL